MSGEIINRVKNNTKLQNLDLEDFYPDEIERLDLKQFLHMELILKEAEFRKLVEEFNWDQYRNKIVAVYCSTDAIIAPWAYMIVSSRLDGIAQSVLIADPDQAAEDLMISKLEDVDWSAYSDKFVMIKGCSNKPVSSAVFAKATNLLQPFARKIMYGEACSNVPIWNKPKNNG